MKSTKDSLATIWGWVIAVLIFGAMLKWYNHLFLINHLPYWKCAILAVPVLVVAHTMKWTRYAFGVLFGAALICQTLVWLSVMSAPLFK